MSVKVQKMDEKTWGVFIGDYCIGFSKSETDALFHKYQLEKKFEEAKNE
jgi:hypothetical protein